MIAEAVASRSGASDENLSAHLQMIQGVIGRMGQNAFNAKTWAITVMAAVVALGSFSSGLADAAVVVLALFLFWSMDAYFFRQERLYRALYDAAVRGEAPLFSLDTSLYAGDVPNTLTIALSRSVWLVHAITILAVVLRAWKGSHGA